MLGLGWFGYAVVVMLSMVSLFAVLVYAAVKAWRRVLRRGAVVVLGLVLARYVPSRGLRRLLRVTVFPAVAGFLVDQGGRAIARKPGKVSSASLAGRHRLLTRR